MSNGQGIQRGGGRAAASVVVACLVTLLWVGGGSAGAIETDTFSLTPSPLVVQGLERRSFHFDPDAGEVMTDAVRVANTTDEPRRYRLYGADATRDPATGNVVVEPADIEARGVGSWVEFERAEIEVPAGAWEIVPFTVTRPAGTTAEGVGAVVAEELLGEAESEGVELVYRLAILIRLDGDVAGLQVGRPRLEPTVEILPSRSTVTTTLTNETLAPVRATVSFTAGGLTGRYWEVGEQQVRLEVGESAEVTAEWDTVPRWGGLFSPAAEVSWEGGSLVRTGPRALHPPLWLLALAIVLVALRGLRELRADG